MTPEAQRTAIAKACGWTLAADGVWRSPDNSHHDRLPDYLSDLNAMQEAETWLRCHHLDLWVGSYWTHLTTICQCHREGGMLRAVHATAAQRAEAFLRCLGRWAE